MDRGVAVIEFDGQITLGDGSGVLREAVNQAITDGHKNILLDLEGVSYIDSAGFGRVSRMQNSGQSARGATFDWSICRRKSKACFRSRS